MANETTGNNDNSRKGGVSSPMSNWVQMYWCLYPWIKKIQCNFVEKHLMKSRIKITKWKFQGFRYYCINCLYLLYCGSSRLLQTRFLIRHQTIFILIHVKQVGVIDNW